MPNLTEYTDMFAGARNTIMRPQIPEGFRHRLHLDYETFSELNIKKCGAYKYARHHSTQVLMLGWAIDDEPAELWEPNKEPMPPRLRAALVDPAYSKHAFNAAFERLITRYCLQIEVPYNQWRCSMVESYYLGFAGGLDTTLEAIGLERKDSRGGQLINLFCTPAPRNHKADRYDEYNRPSEWAELCAYCLKDVKVERQLYHWMLQFPGMCSWDWDQWFLDQRINDRGVPMDLDMAHGAIELWDLEKKSLTEQLAEMTGLPLVTRGPFLEWMEINMGVTLENLRKDYLSALLSKGGLPEEARPYVDLWAQKEGKAVSKYAAAINATRDDGRAGGMFQYKGASRTDRVGGRLIQLQNLKRPFAKSLAQIQNVVSAIKSRDPSLVRMLYPSMSVSALLGGAIRHVIRSEEGKSFAICDLSSVESVILGWVTGCSAIDRTFRNGQDSYKVFAAEFYGIPYSEVTKEQRGFAKPPVLGCGFMLGWKGLIAYSEGYGVEMEAEQAKRAVSTFRGMYPEIPQFWTWIYDAVKYVTITGKPVSGYRMTIERDVDFLRINLPSGRALSYYKPEVKRKEAPWSTPDRRAFVDNFCYMGMDDKNQWVRIYAHAGGVTENIVQSIAGDLLWNGISLSMYEGLDVVLHVHDEIVVEDDDAVIQESLTTLQRCMTTQPPWAQDMWIGADGFVTKRYTKD